MNDRIKKKIVKRVFKMMACRIFEEKNGVNAEHLDKFKKLFFCN